MAYARPFGQPQGASPWSSGVPPGMQQQQAQPQAQMQPMFNQPMGAFDISNSWQGQQQVQPQWVAQSVPQVQFVPNPAFVPQQAQMRQPPMQQQRPMHQRSLSAPRNGVNGSNRQMNQNQGGNWHRGQQNNNSNQFQNRVARQQSRMNTSKGQFNNNNNKNFNNNNNNNNHNNNNRANQQGQQQPQQQQQKQQHNQQSNSQSQKKGPVKVTKVKKLVAVKAKQAPKQQTAKVTTSTEAQAKDALSSDDQPKSQSKTAERKQLKLQARKVAEGLQKSQMPAIKGTKTAANADQKDEPIDQAQMMCVPAVFGYVCKLCEVFLRDKIARREHIDSESHMVKFRAFEQEENAKKEEQQQQDAEIADAAEGSKEGDEAETTGGPSSADQVTKSEVDGDEADTHEAESANPDNSEDNDS